MTPEILMLRRYKVMGEYPGTVFCKGETLVENNERFAFTVFVPTTGNLSRWIAEGVVDKYPNIFRQMFWAEERFGAHMPDYVRVAPDGYPHRAVDWKKDEHENIYFLHGETQEWRMLGNMTPATESDYLNYLNEKG